MAELWTCSGINNRPTAADDLADYVAATVADPLSMPPLDPARRYISRLGTLGHYDRAHNVLHFDAERMLDTEARAFAVGRIDRALAVAPGSLRRRALRVMLIAPKTTTPPPADFAGTLHIHWGSYDIVPNQGIFRPDSLTYWRQYTKNVYPTRSRHGIEHYLRANLKIAKRVRRRRHGGSSRRPRYRYTWIDTDAPVPPIRTTLKHWLTEDDNTLILLAHSQGTNIAMHLLCRGLNHHGGTETRSKCRNDN